MSRASGRAVHYFFYFSMKDMRLLLGAHDVTLEEERRRMECKVMRLQPHPGYDGSTKHDIMLVQHKCSTVSNYFLFKGHVRRSG